MPRSKDEVLSAMDSTWQVVEQWLAGWSPERLTATVRRQRADGTTQLQDHHSLLVRLISHEGYHAGEVALILALHGIEAIDIWQTLEAEPALHAEKA